MDPADAAEALVRALDAQFPTLQVATGVVSGIVQVIVSSDGIALTSRVMSMETSMTPDTFPEDWK
jgi:hypothetical protein